MSRPESYKFGPFRYDPQQRLLFRADNGAMVPLVPKAIEMLEVLLQRRGTVVEKADLLRLVWPETHVEEIALARTISALRRTLGDDGETYIETIPKRGYRFVAPEPAAAASQVTNVATPLPRGRRRAFALLAALAAAVALAMLIYWQFYVPSRFAPKGDFANLAVVPFEVLGPEAGPFAAGLNASLPAALAQLPRVRVISPSTVRRHQRAGLSTGLMGRLLGLDVLVEGTVQPLGDRVRITARLVDVHTGAIVMAEIQDCSPTNPQESQEAVIAAISSRIAAHLSIHGRFS